MQTDMQAIEPVRQSVIVRRPLAETFVLFTDELDSWWPLHTHSIAADTFEGRVTVESITSESRLGAARPQRRQAAGYKDGWQALFELFQGRELRPMSMNIECLAPGIHGCQAMNMSRAA
jgi:hypothetical protein